LKLKSLVGSLFCLLAFTYAIQLQAAEKWIDVHFHVVGDEGKLQDFAATAPKLLEVMDEYNIKMALIMSPPRPFKSFDIDELSQLQKQAPNRIAIMGGGGKLNYLIQKYGHDATLAPEIKQQFTQIAENILAKGAVGFGEITAHHVSLNAGHGYESVPADNPLLLLLADIAAKHGVPIDFHFDPIPEDMDTPSELTSPKNPPMLKENIAGFERLLEHNPKAIIVWAHAGADPVGFYTPELVERLMKKHPNLNCSIRTTFKRNHPLRNPRGHINSDWIDVVEEFPDRFVMGTDSFVITPDYTGPDGPRIFSRIPIQRVGVNDVLAHLDDDLAKKIGYENAIRIYKLKVD
jgi:predicted TIM-barrel fold metal-dependent hydrolase